MNKKLRRFTSYIVLIAIIISLFPVEIFANAQSTVNSGVTLTSVTATSGYSVRVDWTSPKAVYDPDPANIHEIKHFNVDIENVVTGAKEKSEQIDALQGDKGGQKYTADITRDLLDGYLYRFTVTPYHEHIVTNQDGTSTVTPAPMSSTTETDDKAFFLTDIQVGGSGVGDSLTVVWDNPSDLIKKYRISYKKISTDDPLLSAEGVVEVDTSDPLLTTITDKDRGNQRYSYKITNASVISSANMYDITVEPIFNGGTAQEGKKNIKLTENGKNIPVTVKDTGDNSGKYTTVITTDLPLELEELDERDIKLTWTGLDGATISATEKLEVWISETETFDKYTIGTTFYGTGCNIGYWTTAKPKTKMFYKIVVTFKVGDDGKVRPPMTSNVQKYDPKYVPFTPIKPDILEVKTVIPNAGSYQLDMTWSAFIRSPYTENEVANTENGDGKTYIDKEIKYDIWVSDDITGLYKNSVSPILADITPDNVNNIIFRDKDNNNIIAYNTLLSQYAKKTDSGYQTTNLIPNTLYYIKIVAKKEFDDETRISEPEYLLVYFNEAGNIFTPPMLSKPPLKVKKDENNKDMITQTEVTIEWKTKWREILQGEEWVYTENSNSVTDSVYRDINLDDGIKYEYIVVPYSDIEKFASDNYKDTAPPNRNKIYDDYVKKVVIPQETDSTSIFTEITDPKYDVNDRQRLTLYTTLTGLQPNTEYVILFRAYRALDEIRLKSDPSYLAITTLPKDTAIVEVPTVPTLFLREKSDTSITPKWRDDGFKYELSISDKILTDPGTGTIIKSDEITENGVKFESDADFTGNGMYYKINGLFPETPYYIWIRAISDTSPTPSAWSTPLYVVTDPLAKPDPPAGLGLVSALSLKYINDADSTKYTQTDKNYLIVEWMKDVNDTSAAYSSSMTGDSGMLGAPEIQKTMIAMFKNLIPNKTYWVRAATRVVVTKGGNNAGANSNTGLTKTYSYVIQVADNEDFTDAIEIEVPTKYAEPSGEFRMEISDFSTPKHFKTKPSTDDYDTDVDPSLYPLPDQDFELIYDSKTYTLTHRLRSNEIGQDGMPDNRVDQRVINKIINTGMYTYAIDVSKYEDKIVNNRVVEIPFSLLETFNQRDVNIQITADNMTLIINPNLMTFQTGQEAIGYGDSSKLIITMNQDASLPLASTNFTNSTGYLSQTQKVSMSLQTPKSTTDIKYTADPMTVKLKTINRYDIYDKNVAPYIFNENSSEWERADSPSYNNETSRYSFDTTKVSAYTVLGIEAPKSSESSESFKTLSNKINITDMRDYKSSDPITANQLNNLIYSIAKNQQDVSLNRVMSESELGELSKSGLSLTKTGDSPVSRQEAINSISKLYELKTGSKIQTEDISSSSLVDIDSVSVQYQQGILKAEEIGLINGTVKPNETMTLDDTAKMINTVLDDTF